MSTHARLGAVLLILVLSLTAGAPAARAFDPAKTPAVPVESARWGSLQPGGIFGDMTGFAFHRDPKQSEPFNFAVDVENGWVFVATGRGLEIFDARTTPDNPQLVGYGYGPNPSTQGQGGLMPVWYQSDEDFYLQELDAPPGNDNVVAIASYGQGFSIWNTSQKAGPTVHYQDTGVLSTAVYSAYLGNRAYAFAISGTGAYLYDLTEAQTKTKCLDDSFGGSFTCGAVYKGRVGTVSGPVSVHGVGPFVAFGTGRLFEIWNVSTPTSPVKVMTGAQPARGIAMWQEGSSYYLAAGNFGKVRIYDVSCIAGGACNVPPELKVLDVPGGQPPLSRVSFSRASGGVPYLYISGDDTVSCVPQREYLFNVSNPANPVEISPNVNPGGYWGWYYEACASGYNWVSPRGAKFSGNYLYRAAYSIGDVHRLVGAQPPTANFSWPDGAVYAGVQVQFTDQSSGSPAPDSWEWNFPPDGTPASWTAGATPQPVVFSTPGQKAVNLRVHNTEGWSQVVTRQVTVLDPTPQIGGVTVLPANPVICQPITFTGTGVSGLPALGYSWSIPDASPAPSPTNANPLVWSTTASTTPGTYTATLTVSNAQGSAARSATVQVGPLQTINPSFAPTIDDPTPPAGTVTLGDHQEAGSATEWSWDFDDDGNAATIIWGPWSNDPASRTPTHSYSSTGLKTVRVRVRNCLTPDQATGIVSGPLEFTITVVTPLKALFSPVCVFCFFEVGQEITFNDQSTGASFWDYDWDGNGSYEDANNTAPRTTHVYTTAGIYTPKLQVRRGAEQDIYTLPTPLPISPTTPGQITVGGPSSGQPNQALSFTAAAGASCHPSANGWSWSAAGGTITGGTTSDASITWSSTGTKSISVTNSACPGVTGSKTVTIGTSPPPPPPPPGGLKAEFSFTPAAPAANQAVSFSGAASSGSPTGYTWDFGDGSAFGSGVQVSHTYTKTGSFTVQLVVTKESSNCPPAPFCDSVATKTVTVGTGEPPLIASFQTSASCITDFGFNVCTAGVGEAVTFTNTSTGDPTSWTWAFGDGGTATGTGATHAFQQPGSYTVTLTVGKGSNTNTASRMFNVSGEPGLGASFSTSAACTGNTCAAETHKPVTFTSTSTGNPTSWAWSFGDGGTATGASATHTFSQPGNYTVTLTVGKGANSAASSRTFNVTAGVEPEASTVVLPWVAQSRGVLAQSSNLFLHNPGTTPMEVVLEFRRQGTPEANPPRAALTIQPGATQYVV
ncbi:MAG: PKD domain-containing protein, partial [Thermoanaerobaculia bacterium]